MTNEMKDKQVDNMETKTYYNSKKFKVTMFPRHEKKDKKEVIIWIVQVHFKKTNEDLYFRKDYKINAQTTAMSLADDILYHCFDDYSPETFENYITDEYFSPISRDINGYHQIACANPEEDEW